MKLVRPFFALLPNKNHIGKIIAPPYDVLNREQATLLAQDNPYSFLHISKPEIDFPLTVDQYDTRIYTAAKVNLQHFMENQNLQENSRPAYYVYRLTDQHHQQTGIVAAISVEAYGAGRVRRHELTQPEKENDRVRHLKSLKIQSSPVLLAYRENKNIEEILFHTTEKKAQLSALDNTPVLHELWPVYETDMLDSILNACETLYIADGHHRAAASFRLAKENPYFLGVLFAHSQLRILGYHRVVKDLHGLTPDEFLTLLAMDFHITLSTTITLPTQTHEFGMFLNKQWYKLILKRADLSEKLPTNILYQHILQPILHIGDQRTDPRIAYVGGDDVIGKIEGLDYAASFLVAPTPMEDLLAVADDNLIMPPKSTWFSPKLADGMIVMTKPF